MRPSKLFPVVIVLLGTVASAQGPVIDPEPRRLNDEFRHHATGDDIPRFLVVRTFFKIGVRQVRHSSPDVLHNWLTELGIDEESAAADVLVDGVLAAEPVIDRSTHDFSLDGEAYERFKERETRRLAADLARHFARLEAALAREGYAPVRLDAYLRDRILPSMMLASTEEGPSDLLISADRYFTVQLDAMRAALSAEEPDVEAEQ